MEQAFPILPETNVETIEKSGLKQEVFDRLCSGWSPARVSGWLTDQGCPIHASEIERFFAEIPDIYILPPTLVKTKLLMLDVKIDSLSEMGRTLRLMEERLEAYLLTQELAGDQSSLAKLDSQYRKDLEAYFSMLERYTKMLQSLGLLEQVPQKIDLTSGGEKLPTLRSIIEGRDAA